MDDLDSAARVGVLVPSANPVVEPELHRLLPGTMKMYAARMPVMPDTTLMERNRRYLDTYEPTMRGFGAMRLDAVLVAMTGPSYRLLPEGDAALIERLSVPGTPVQTAANAIRLALEALGARRICLVSPYEAWLTDEAVGYWTAAGHEVAQVVSMSEEFRAYSLTTGEVADALRTVRPGTVDAIVMSGTGMITLPAILSMRAALPVPFLSSNLCCAWWVTRELGQAPSATLAAACPELAG